MKTRFFFLALGSFIMLSHLSNAQEWVITTFAGNGVGMYGGDDSLATHAGLMTPSGVAADRHGNIFIVDQNNNRCRKVSPTGIITTYAGTGTAGYNGDSILATNAQLYWPTGVAVDRKGNVYIADQFNERIRKIDTAGIITTIAGNGTEGYSGDSSSATAAQFAHPADVGVDSIGNVYIIDQDNSAVRKVDTEGIITTIAGNGTAGFSVDSGLAIYAQLNFPQGIAVDRAGNIYIADFYNSRIRKITVATGIITTVAGNGSSGYGGDDSLAINAKIYDASSVAVDDSNNIYISDYYNNRIRKVRAATGIITTVAGNGISGYSGDDSLATSGEIFHSEGVAVDTNGNIFIADFNNHVVRKVTKIDTSAVTTNTQDISSAPGFSVFPNPSDGRFTIRLNKPAKNYTATIYDILGKTVYHTPLYKTQNVIDIFDNQSGIYYVNIKCDENSLVRSIVIRH